jgi:hypothetical protein
MSSDGDNFFSRWSRRKVQVRSGEPLPAEPPAPTVAPVAKQVAIVPVVAPTEAEVAVPTEVPQENQPALTLDDVARLTPDSDFSSFVAKGVPANVRNAAVKKLFTDPHFNVMDGLDIYIDDYSKPSPLSMADMAKMVGAQFLKLVDDPNEPRPTAVAPGAPAVTEDSSAPHPEEAPSAETQATSPPEAEPDPEPATEAGLREPTAPEFPETHDDHADLQLQPDDAPGPQGPGHGAG